MSESFVSSSFSFQTDIDNTRTYGGLGLVTMDENNLFLLTVLTEVTLSNKGSIFSLPSRITTGVVSVFIHLCVLLPLTQIG